jgi:ATP-dependent RNA helicase DOB1
MPAHSVLFTDAYKWDGRESRPLSSGEYIQMSGRAGRRGMDQRGITLLMAPAATDAKAFAGILSGQSEELNSSFRFDFSMILNLLRYSEINYELKDQVGFLAASGEMKHSRFSVMGNMVPVGTCGCHPLAVYVCV